MKLTRRQMFAGLLAPFAAPKLLEAAKTFTIAAKPVINPPNRYNSDTFYRMGVDFERPSMLTRLEGHALEQTMLNVAAINLHRKATEAAAGRHIIWCSPMEIIGFVDRESVGPIGPVPRCRHIMAYDIATDRWIHRVDVEVAFTEPKMPSGTRYFECNHQVKIGDTINVRRPIRWLTKQG